MNQLEQLDKDMMSQALLLAKKAASIGEVPVGAVVVDPSGNIVGEGYNLRESHKRATAHAEIIAIDAACSHLGRWRLSDCTLYVTLEPCFMCAGAIILARLPRVVYGAKDPKAGAVHSLSNVLTNEKLNHICTVTTDVCAEESAELLKSFFKLRRTK